MRNSIIFTLTIMIFGQLFGQKMKDVDNKYVFDKADYHFESVQEAGLEDDQAYVHSGLFLAWLIEKNLISEFLKEESRDDINKLKNREISPSQIYKDWDGVLIGELLNKEGYNFALHYFDFEKGRYLADYGTTFSIKDPDIFTVTDTWENYEKIKTVIDKAYKKWKK